MRRPLLALSLVIPLLLASPAWALPTEFQQAAERALASSPSVAALDKAIEAATARARAAGAWPNPVLVSQLQVSTNYTANMVTVGMRQPLDFRGLSQQRRAYAEEEVASLTYERERLRARVAYDARMAFMQLWIAEASVAAHTRNVAFIEGEFARGRKRVAEGALAAHELVHVEYELASARAARRVAVHSAERARARLNLLWGRPVGASIAMPAVNGAEPVSLAPLEDWLESARARRPELKAAAVAVRRETRAVRLAESLRFGEGEIDLQAGTTSNTDPTLYGAFGLPVPLWNSREGEISAARAETSRLEADRIGLEQSIAQEVADAYLEVRQAAERYREADAVLVPLSEHALEKAQARVRAGAGQPTEILEARKEGLDAASARLQALLEYHQAMLRLEYAAGR